jgi:hypothetical protein
VSTHIGRQTQAQAPTRYAACYCIADFLVIRYLPLRQAVHGRHCLRLILHDVHAAAVGGGPNQAFDKHHALPVDMGS